MSKKEDTDNQDTTEAQVAVQTAGEQVGNDRPLLRLGDNLIAVVRELITLTMLTGTNIVDHLRAVRVDVTDGVVNPTEEYIEAYNAQVEALAKQAEEQQEEMQKKLAGDSNIQA